MYREREEGEGIADDDRCSFVEQKSVDCSFQSVNLRAYCFIKAVVVIEASYCVEVARRK